MQQQGDETRQVGGTEHGQGTDRTQAVGGAQPQYWQQGSGAAGETMTITGGGPQALAWLVVVASPMNGAVGRLFRLNDQRAGLVIGRGTDAGILIEDQGVSRPHARVWGVLEQGDKLQYYVQDMASRGGTKLNGRLIDSKEALTDGDCVKVGNTELVFKQVVQAV